jgi:hypothetical protein
MMMRPRRWCGLVIFCRPNRTNRQRRVDGPFAARMTMPSISAYRNGVLIHPAALSAKQGRRWSCIGAIPKTVRCVQDVRIAVLPGKRA